MAMMGVFWAISEARYAERENRLAQLELQGIKNALHAHGVQDLTPHLPGEKP